MSNRKRRVVMIESMFRDICTKEELNKVDELYTKGYKASAVVFMTKRIKEKWDKIISLKPSTPVDSGNNFRMLRPIQF